MSSKIQIRRDTSSNWGSIDPILASGEWGLETNTRIVKVGDGTTEWSSLLGFNITHLSGTTSNIQTQLNGKASSIHTHNWADIVSGKPTTLSGYGITDAVSSSRTLTIQGTTNQISVSPTTQDLSDNRTWTLSLPQDIHTGATPAFSGMSLIGTGSVLAIRGTGTSIYGSLRFGTTDSGFTNWWAGIESSGNSIGLDVADLRFYTTFGTRSQKFQIHYDNRIGVEPDSRIGAGNGYGTNTTATAQAYLELYNGTDGNTRLINTGAFSIILGTNNSERMRITSAGNVLIGTNTDNTVDRLQVNGSAIVNGANFKIDSGSGRLTFEPSNGFVPNTIYSTTTNFGGFSQLNFHSNGNYTFVGGRPIEINTSGGGVFVQGEPGGWATGYFFRGSSGTFRGGFGAFGGTNDLGYYYIGEFGNEFLTVRANGTVGIGTTTPNTILEVRELNRVFDGYGNINVFTTNTGTQNVGGSIAFGGDSFGATTPYPFAKIQGIKEGAGAWSGALLFGTTQSSSAIIERMRITSSGNVGIRTTTPVSSLTVVGIGGTDEEVLTVNTNNINDTTTAIGLGGHAGFATGQVQIRAHHHHFAHGHGELSFWTRNSSVLSEAGRFSKFGNLLLGTTTEVASGFGSDYKLVVNSTNQYNTALFRSTSHAMVQVESTSAANQAIMRFFSPTRGWGIGLNTDGRFFIGDETAPATRLSITTGGNLLVGTTTDNTVDRLQVSGSILGTTDAAFGDSRKTNGAGLTTVNIYGSSNFGTTPAVDLKLNNVWNGVDYPVILRADYEPLVGAAAVDFSLSVSAFLGSQREIREAIRVKGGTLNVGISTDNPTQRMDINGNIRVRSLTTATGDFVTADANGVFSRRTASQVRSDLDLNTNYIQNQNLGSQTANYWISGTARIDGGTIFSSATSFQFLTATTSALSVDMGSLLVSDSYSDRTLVPTNGAYIKGAVINGVSTGVIGSNPFLYFNNDASGSTPSYIQRTHSNGQLEISTDGDLVFSASVARMRIVGSNGNVVINGTDNAVDKLQVTGSTVLNGVSVFYNLNGGNFNENIRLPESSSGYASIHMGGAFARSGTGTNQWTIIKAPSALNHRFAIWHNDSQQLGILTDGTWLYNSPPAGSSETAAIFRNAGTGALVTRTLGSMAFVDTSNYVVNGIGGAGVLGKSTIGAGAIEGILAGTNGVLRRNGTGNLEFGTLVTGNIGDNQITLGKLEILSGYRIIGNPSPGAQTPVAIHATNDDTVLRRYSGSALEFGKIFPAHIDGITSGTVLGRSSSGTGAVEMLSISTLFGGYVPTTRTITINGTGQDLSINRVWSIGLQSVMSQSNVTSSIYVMNDTNFGYPDGFGTPIGKRFEQASSSAIIGLRKKPLTGEVGWWMQTDDFYGFSLYTSSQSNDDLDYLHFFHGYTSSGSERIAVMRAPSHNKLQIIGEGDTYVSGGVGVGGTVYFGWDILGGHINKVVSRGRHGFWNPRYAEHEEVYNATTGITIDPSFHAIKVIKSSNGSSFGHTLDTGLYNNQELILTLVNTSESASGGNSVVDGVSQTITNPENTITKAFLIWDVDAQIWMVMSTETV